MNLQIQISQKCSYFLNIVILFNHQITCLSFASFGVYALIFKA